MRKGGKLEHTKFPPLSFPALNGDSEFGKSFECFVDSPSVSLSAFACNSMILQYCVRNFRGNLLKFYAEFAVKLPDTRAL